jgi:hypothetical protein
MVAAPAVAPVTLNVPVVVPGEIETLLLGLKVTCPAPLDARAIVVPPGGAGASSVIVPLML